MRPAKQILQLALGALLLGVLGFPAFARVESEVSTPEKRKLSVERAVRLSKQTKAAPSDHDLLESIAEKIKPSGTFNLGGQPILAIGKRFVKTGSHFIVTYKGSDYDLELTGIDGSNFTLRYKSEEITRSIQPGKSP